MGLWNLSDQMKEERKKVIEYDGILKGWSRLLSSYLLRQTNPGKYQSFESALLFSLISRLRIVPDADSDCSTLLASFCNFITTTPLSAVLEAIPSSSRLESFLHLFSFEHASRRNSFVDCDEDTDEGEIKIKKNRAVFAISTMILDEDEDFIPKSNNQNIVCRSPVVTIEALRILHKRYIGDVETTYTLFEIIIYIISIIPRLKCEYTCEFFRNVLEYYTCSEVPLLDDKLKFNGWRVLCLTISDASFTIAMAELGSADWVLFLDVYMVFAASCAKEIVNGLKRFLWEHLSKIDKQLEFLPLLNLLSRFLNTVLDVIKIRLKNSSRFTSFIPDTVYEFFFDIIRDTFVFIELLLSDDQYSVFDYFITNIAELYLPLLEQKKIRRVERDFFLNQCNVGDQCIIKFSLTLFVIIVQNCSMKSILSKVLKCIRCLPKGLCPCVERVFLFLLLTDTTSKVLLEDFIDTFNFHMEPTAYRRMSNQLPDNCLAIFIEKVRNSNIQSDVLLLKFLCLTLPHIAISDSQKIMEEFVSRLFPHVMNPQNKITYPVEAVHLLKNNISGENLVDFVTSCIINPVLKHPDPSFECFDFCCELSRSVLFSSLTPVSSIENLISLFSIIFECDLELAKLDIWKFISCHQYTNRLIHTLILISCCYIHFGASARFVHLSEEKKLACTSLFWLDLCLDWIQAPVASFKDMQRFASIFSLIISILLSHFHDKENFLRNLEFNLLPLLMNSLNFYLINKILCELLAAARMFNNNSKASYVFFASAHDTVVTDNETTQNEEKNRCTNGTLSGLKLIHPELCVFVVRILSECFKRSPESCKDGEFCLQMVSSLLKRILLSSSTNTNDLIAAKLTPTLMELVEVISMSTISCETFESVLSIYIELIAVVPHSELIKHLLSYIRKAPHFQRCIFEALFDLIRKPVDPSLCILFPQKEFQASCVESRTSPLITSITSTCTIFDHLSEDVAECTSEYRNVLSLKNNKKNILDKTIISEDSSENLIDDSSDFHLAAEIFIGRWMNIDVADGFSVSFWLRIKHVDFDDLLVVARMFAVCALSSAFHNFYLMYCQQEKNLYIIYKYKKEIKKYFLSTIENEHWTHITISISTKDAITLMACINGQIYKNVTVHFSPIFDNFFESSSFAFGTLLQEDETPPSVVMEMAAFLGFEGALNKERIMVLHAIGYRNLSVLLTSINAIYLPIIPPLNYHISRRKSTMLFNWDEQILYLQRQLVFWINCISIDSNKNQSKVELILKIKDKTQPKRVIQKSCSLNWRCEVIQKRFFVIDNIVHSHGGVRLFLYLFAQAVDMKADSKTVAIALRLLKTSLSIYCLWKNEITAYEIGLVINRCLASPLNTVDSIMINEVLFLSVSKLELQRGPVTNPVFFSTIFDPEFLTNILLQEIILDSCNYQPVKESFHATSSVVAIVFALSKYSKDPDNIKALWQFVFLSNPAAFTFINHIFKRRNSWIDKYQVNDELIYSLERTELVIYLDAYAEVLGRDFVIQKWAENRSVIELRELFEEKLKENPSKWRLLTSNSEGAFCKYDGSVKENFSAELNNGINSDKSIENIVLMKQHDYASSGWINCLRSDLLQRLSDFTKNAPDYMATFFLPEIDWRSILALFSVQTSILFRDSVCQFIGNFLLRSNDKVRMSFLKNRGFLLLANQIRDGPVTPVLVNMVFTLLFGDSVNVTEGIQSDYFFKLKISEFSCACLVAIFAVWEESVNASDVSLFCIISSAILEIYQNNSSFMEAMIGSNLCETLVIILRRIAFLAECKTVSTTSISLFLKNWDAVAIRVIDYVPYSNAYHYDMCKRFILLMVATLNSFDKKVEAKMIVRQGLCMLLKCWFDTFHANLLNEELFSNAVASTAVLESESFNKRQNSSIPFNCLVDRFLFCLRYARGIFIFLQPIGSESFCEEEQALFNYFINFIRMAFQLNLDPLSLSQQNIWIRLIHSCREKLRNYFLDLIRFLLFSAAEKSQGMKPSDIPSKSCAMEKRLLIVNLLVQFIPHKILLNLLHGSDLDDKHTLNLALHELAVIHQLNDDSAKEVDDLIRFSRFIQIQSPFVHLNPDRHMSLCTDEELAIQKYIDTRQEFLEELQQALAKVSTEENDLSDSLSEIAMSSTCRVVEDQNRCRRSFVKIKRQTDIDNTKAENILAELVIDFCHPESICYDSLSWPNNWALDPTEGPNRERKRLIAAHITFEERFIMPEFAKKLESRYCPPPLSRLLDGGRINIKETSFIQGLAADERIRFSTSATIVRSTVESNGEILIGDKNLYFCGDITRSVQTGTCTGKKITSNFSWKYDDIVEIYNRYYLLKDIAIELFCMNKQTYLIVFEDKLARDHFRHRLFSMNLKNLIKPPERGYSCVTQHWREGKISNFMYLMHLNKLAGRSYNDLMQYPVFPFILSNYGSVLDLNDPGCYRDLSKPIAIQDKRMEDHYLRNYSYLQNEQLRINHNRKSILKCGPYHYGSHYSNSGIVIHYLVRLPPFTNLALEYQDHNFDIADRLFNSVEAVWNLASSDSTTDFKELIPEFFFLPEFLINSERLNLGVRQDGSSVNDVILPNWCANSARLFILVHRQALESQFVTAHLHSWIDLIFGYKQTGQAAIQAINVFHPSTYRDGLLNANIIDDEVSLSALRTMIRTYGQMPEQLFHSAHQPHFPPKNVSKKVDESPLPTVIGINWGEFLGSPASHYGPAIVICDQYFPNNDSHISQVQSTIDGSCFAYPHHTLLISCKERLSSNISSCGLVSWQFSDRVLRYKPCDSTFSDWISLVHLHSFSVTAIDYCSSKGFLFIALSSFIHVYRISWNNTTLQDFTLQKTLLGHSLDVSAIATCAEYAVVVTACIQSKVCVWDLNRLCFIRTLDRKTNDAAILATINKINCDVAIAYSSATGYGSKVCLYTINGALIGEEEIDIAVTSMVMSSLPEGTAVNVLVLGMLNGTIRIYETWTFSQIQIIVDDNFLEPILSMSFAAHCTRLYTCLASGRILCWQGAKNQAKEISIMVV